MAATNIGDFITREHQRLICDNLRHWTDILIILYDKAILNRDMRDTIHHTDGRYDKIRLLVEIINRHGEPAYQVFLDALLATDQGDLAKALKVEDTVLCNSRRQNEDGNCIIGDNEGELPLDLKPDNGPGSGYMATGSSQTTQLSPDAMEQNENSFNEGELPLILIPCSGQGSGETATAGSSQIAQLSIGAVEHHENSFNEGELPFTLEPGSQGSGDTATGSSQLSQLSSDAMEQNENSFQSYPIEAGVFTDDQIQDGLLSKRLKVKYCDKFVPDDFNEKKCYRNFTEPKGRALIFNMRFKNHTEFDERRGTEVDCHNLKWLLESLGYKVEVELDLTAEEVTKSMERFASATDHKTYDSAVVAVMTHGDRGRIFGNDGEPIEIDHFLQFLDNAHCPALRRKPKLFIIQACRGKTYDEGVDGPITDGVKTEQQRYQLQECQLEQDAVDARAICKKLPHATDMIMAYSTTPGHYSIRNTVHGSWFIRAICKVFSAEAWQEDILHLLTMVNDRVAKQTSNKGLKQIPSPTFSLRKKFFFYPCNFNASR